MFKSSVALVLMFASSAGAQSTSYVTSNPAPIKGDPNRMVCQKEDKIGTRLGGEKVCHTVAEWREIYEGNRDNVERLQMGARARCEECSTTQFSFGDLTEPNGGPPVGMAGGPPR